MALLKRWLPWGVAVAVLAVLFTRIPFAALRGSLSQGRYLVLAAYVLFEILAVLPFDAWGTREALTAAGVRRGFGEVLLARGATYLLGLLSYLVGQGGVGVWLARRGVKGAQATAAVFLLVVSNGIVLVLIAAAGLLLDPPEEQRGLLMPVVAACFAGILVYLALIALRPAWLARWGALAPLFEAGLAGHLRAIAARVPHMLLLALLHWGAFRVWGIPVPLLRGIALMPVVLLVSALPITPGGLGSTQALQVALLLPLGDWRGCRRARLQPRPLRLQPGGDGRGRSGLPRAAAPAPSRGRDVKVLLFYDCVYPGSVGGVEHRNHELARALAARGHQVTLAGFCDAPSEPFPGVAVLPVGPAGALYTSSGKRSTSEALRFARAALRLDVSRFDVVEAANIPYIHLPALALRCRRACRPLVVTWHEYWGRYWRRYLGAKWPFYAAIERATAHLGTAAVAVSRLTADRVQRVRGGEVPVIPNGVPVESIRRAAEEGRGEGPPLVYAGRLLREKRIDLLLEAVARLGSAGTDACHLR